MPGLDSAITSAALKLWDLFEFLLCEVESAALLKFSLKTHGSAITSEGTSNIPNACIAESGSSRPLLG